MHNDDFVDTVYSLGKLHKNEMGITYPKLLKNIT